MFQQYAIIICSILQGIHSIPAVKNLDIWHDDLNNSILNDFYSNYHVSNNSVRFLDENDISRYPRVLNFFPVPVEEECKSTDGRRIGICMNTYECRINNGMSFGFCALGFGVCCIFAVTCDQEAKNNLTYFVNPNFPDLTAGMTSCSLTVKKIDPEVSQFRLDFIHFNLGQPNRKSGVCEEDIFLVSSEDDGRSLTMCGINSGQHVYYDIQPTQESLHIRMNLSREAVSRLWEIRITQIPFQQRAPVGCLQYFEGSTGKIETMNFGDNGRHLANQDYNICIRQDEGMCSITYQPCHENAFRISPNNENGMDPEDLGSGEVLDTIHSREMDICSDRIVIPCESDDFIMPGDGSPVVGVCDQIHCGSMLCPSGERPCKIESSATPFTIGIHFGTTSTEVSPEDNLGMCLTYDQLPCN